MKRLVCALAAVVSVALSGGTFATSTEDNQVTGTVVQVNEAYMEIDTGNGGGPFGVYLSASCKPPKRGERVRVHYTPAGRIGRLYCDKIEKLGKAEAGSKER
jgi:uncharacterized cupredoxin-like copper-binding protein